jgi:hypothetical protein
MHIVNCTHDGCHFQRDFFPRKIRYKKAALELAREAELHWAKDITVDGKPFRTVTEDIPFDGV